MFRTDYRLTLALTASLLLHLTPFIRELIAEAPSPTPPPAPRPLEARLRPPPPPPAAELMLPEEIPTPPERPKPPPPPPPERPSTKPAARPASWQQEIRKQFRKQDERGEFYPAEAVARGLEGEVLVLLILDADGQVAAARIEQGSGHRLLDDAALRAVRALHSLPSDAPRESLLPVRFRLR